MIRVLDFDPVWHEQYAREVVRIALGAKRSLGRTEHVGSTAVPWLAARPMIDALAFTAADAQREALRSVLSGLGYALQPPSGDPYVPESWTVMEPVPVRLYLVASDTPFAVDALRIRDHLRVDRTLADAFGAFKRELAARPQGDAVSYEAAKARFLQSILRQARAAK